MAEAQFDWIPLQCAPDPDWLAAVVDQSDCSPAAVFNWLGPLLWQRGHQDLAALAGFLQPEQYCPSRPWAFGPEMTLAVERLLEAHVQQEKVAIWGDFDADGLTATAVLWEGLGQFFKEPDQLCYTIPNRFTESHGLSLAGLDRLAAWGCQLLVTCDTGSTAIAEIAYAQTLGMDVIVTDHHTLPETRPPVVALINPRQLPPDHPLADLSGVAVAYKLVEALYEQRPDLPTQPLTQLLDLVAIGLIADLVNLRGDCRYLAQVGLQTLEQQAKQRLRPGVSKLLELCKRTGDRPSDVAFGLGPRINAVSRIHGDAQFGVSLLTSRDRPQAEALALEAELANTRRKALQATVMAEAEAQLGQLDLATTQVIVLADPQWSPGVLGLVASQLAQTYGRPTLLFQTELVEPEPLSAEPLPAALGTEGDRPLMARGSARSVNQIDLYELVKGQAHLLTSFGGHPFAAGLTLPVENLPLLTAGINRALRSHHSPSRSSQRSALPIDLTITVADLGRDLFKTLKQLEPYGMGNPVPRLLLQNVQFTQIRERALRDQRGGKQRFYQVTFELQDASTADRFPGHWWGHRQGDLPTGVCDAVVELDVNMIQSRYEARLVDCRARETAADHPGLVSTPLIDQRLDQRHPVPVAPPALQHCPVSWSELVAARSATPDATSLTLAYGAPVDVSPSSQWQALVGVAKYLSRTGQTTSRDRWCQRLNISERSLDIGLTCLEALGFQVEIAAATGPEAEDHLIITGQPPPPLAEIYQAIAQPFLAAVQEEQFRRRYFYTASPMVLAQGLAAMAANP
ncbi:MAG: single-stranded-DNA-specific exonuclease RecJ [Leptolyngbya sp. RL_3_1]|nr:single-stranded-DNA-specific exonuclease RecJ [Leptolyngbya sp. RL_3_1]